MSDIEPGWYKDPADPSTQRYWDGEGWIGDPIPADVDPPSGPPIVLTQLPAALSHPAPRLDPEVTDPDATTIGPVPPIGPPGAGPHPPTTPLQQPPNQPYGPPPPFPYARPGLPPAVPPGRPLPPGLSRNPAGPGFVLATPGLRLVARLVDITAVLLLSAAANWLFAYRWWQSFWGYIDLVSSLNLKSGDSAPPVPNDISTLGLIILAVITAVWFAYEVPSSANSGQTLGKRLTGIKVMRLESEERLGFGRSWRRWSRLGIPTLFWSCCGIGLLIQLFDCFSVVIDLPLHQALHDKGAATVVVRTNRSVRSPAHAGVGGRDDRSDPPQSSTSCPRTSRAAVFPAASSWPRTRCPTARCRGSWTPWWPRPKARTATPTWAWPRCKQKLADRLGVAVERVATGCGSVALLEHLAIATCAHGDEMLYSWRSFEAYPIVATAAGATSVQVPNRPDHGHDLPAMAAAITARTRIVLVCNPNNPTGTALRRAELDRFLDTVDPGTLVVLDEAYREFVTDPEVPDGLVAYGDRPNVVVLRTMSKAWGLAGLRVGYLVGQPDVVRAVSKVITPFSTSAVAQAAALAALDATTEMQRRADLVVAERDRVLGRIRKILPEVPETQANFVWLPLGDGAVPFAAACEAAGVIVRPFAGDGVRVTIGTPEENDAFLAAAENTL